MTTNGHNPIANGAAANAAIVNSPLSQLDSWITGFVYGNNQFEQLRINTPTGLSISGGVIIISKSFHTVDTEGAAASDDLDTINGGQVGDTLKLQAANSARTVVIKHNTGNIRLNDANDFSLSDTAKMIGLTYNGTYWSNDSPASTSTFPKFRAYLSGAPQTIANITLTKFAAATESFDTNADYDVATYRFTPTVTGYYWAYTSIEWTLAGAAHEQVVALYKNGVGLAAARNYAPAPSGIFATMSSQVGDLVYMNGTTDYLEVYVYQNSGGNENISIGSSASWFEATRVS